MVNPGCGLLAGPGLSGNRVIAEIRGVVMDAETHVVDIAATNELRKTKSEQRGPIKLICRGPYAETLIKQGLLEVSDPDLECTRCADDAVLDHYWKDLYKYTPRPSV